MGDQSLYYWHLALNIGGRALSCPALRNEPSSFIFIYDKDVGVHDHQSASLCKSVSSSSLSPPARVANWLSVVSLRESETVWATVAVPVVQCHHLNHCCWHFYGKRTAYNVESVLAQRITADQEKSMGWGHGGISLLLCSLGIWGVPLFLSCAIPILYLKTYLGFHMAHFEVVEERRAAKTVYSLLIWLHNHWTVYSMNFILWLH